MFKKKQRYHSIIVTTSILGAGAAYYLTKSALQGEDRSNQHRSYLPDFPKDYIHSDL